MIGQRLDLLSTKFHTHTHVIKQTKNDFLHWLSHRLATLFIRGSSPVMSSVKRARERWCHLRLTLSFDGRCLFCTTCSMKNGTGWQWFITLWGPSGRGAFFFLHFALDLIGDSWVWIRRWLMFEKGLELLNSFRDTCIEFFRTLKYGLRCKSRAKCRWIASSSSRPG